MVQRSQMSQRSPDFVRAFTTRILEGLRSEGLYPVSHLFKELRENNLPCTFKSLLNLEKRGLILEPTERRLIRGHQWRLYTIDRIQEIIKHLKSHPHKSTFR